ncbi:MAG: hypothetical protein A3H28_15705 [Acidobacteria bacterium RIFCSPLOWO2_02_FULL_61_28]|nr:MAG: hypothetical protein A3H28_15705 [Acidobacteria bacterium RIFCSPLOWO2_02_FULL_61_28]
MHIHFSFHHVSRNAQIDKTITSQVTKLEKLLGRFSSDLIRIHGVVEFSAAHKGPVCSLNLWLPTARLNTRHEGDSPLTALQDCFNQLIEQVKKHKTFLRREGVWKRRRYKFKQEALELQAAELRVEDRQQLREYLEQVLPQLAQFVARELHFREMAGSTRSGQPQPEEIINEVVARAFGEVPARPPDAIPPFHRLVSEAIRVLNGPYGKPLQEGSETGLERPGGGEEAASITGKIGAAHLWRLAKETRSSLEVPARQAPDAVDLLLASLPALDRQVYILHALEGFSWEETARVLDTSPVEAEDVFRRVSGQVAAALGGTPARSSPQPGAG